MKPYVLHYAPDNASLIVRLALEEMALPYVTRLVDRSVRQQKTAAYLAMNPAGLIPVLETPDGPIAETGAILLWLSERHSGLAPNVCTPARAAFLQNLLFVSNTVHPLLRASFYPEKIVGPEPQMQTAFLAELTEASSADMTLPRAFAILDEAFAKRAAQPVDVLDYYVACLARWAQIYGAAPSDWYRAGGYEHLNRRFAQLEGRKAVQSAIKAEGLGAAPFTAPQLPNPPEGSAV